MVEEESREKFLREMRNGSLHVDQVRIVDEMAAMPGYMEEWVARCREGEHSVLGAVRPDQLRVLGNAGKSWKTCSARRARPGAALLEG